MLHLTKDSIIYVLCPSGIVTGGIEAVHQLVDKLRLFGHQAYVVPVPPVHNPLLLQYRNYDVPFTNTVVDDPTNILITTEVNPRALDRYSSIQKAIWWLSVDFHEALKDPFDFANPQAQAISHFAQSKYAHDYLSRKGIKEISCLTDYLNSIYFQRGRSKAKNDVVLHTPVKGAARYVQRLMRADPSLQWLALTGMNRQEHAQAMRMGKVYVDFGTHPGKDRQPREAVVNGCCVIVGLAGAACYEEDLPIPHRYKFALQEMEEEKILETIHQCLAQYESRFEDFLPYANVVEADERRFEKEVQAIFGVKSINKKSKFSIVSRNILGYAKQNHPYLLIRGLMNEWVPLPVLGFAKRMARSVRKP